ncbi:MAG: preprotein translocase subunit SecG [Nitrospirae bacterium]|nr:preprotein translocase subunit SecG [Nitrospirota bacterium]
MTTLLVAIHIIVSILIILIVLLQTGKGAEVGAVFGGSSQTIFGSRGAGTFLSRLTTIAAVVFMLTSLSLAYLSKEQVGSSVVDKVKQEKTESAPVQQPVEQPADKKDIDKK